MNLEYFIKEYAWEWDEEHYELGELILSTPVEDLAQHKEVLQNLLAQVMIQVITQYRNGESPAEEVVQLAAAIAEVDKLS